MRDILITIWMLASVALMLTGAFVGWTMARPLAPFYMIAIFLAGAVQFPIICEIA